MTEKTYIFPKLENGLIGLPPDLDVDGIFRKDYADSDTSDAATLSRSLNERYGLSPQQKRVQAFYKVNELVAVYGDDSDSNHDALSKLAAALGTPATPTTQSRALTASAAAAARQKARKDCTAALEAGYRP